MSNKENLQGNEVIATLYVGVGGIGSDIVREVVDLAKASGDNLDRARFVTLDTDVGSLKNSDDGVYITPIQTSSQRTIRDYLVQDDDARTEWFPNNMIINSKSVSEGAGQVRAISRLALNATIRTGRIKALYNSIDELYLKDGSDKKQPIKVAIVSTVAGGTGSGIAMIVGMLIRNCLAKNYPDSAAVIRGFLMMPDVLNSFKPSSSEELSLQRNGYATLKEINAFMMRPFVESVPELNRYLDLHVDVPNSAGGVDRLTSSPFDFCFLFERVDSGNGAMASLGQYKSYMAHSIYEQSIGAMSVRASSAEDNIHKEFLDEKKLSRNRFGGAGASIVRYPYKEIRDYVAYEWIEEQIIGHSAAQTNESDIKKMLSESWLAYDAEYRNKEAEFKAGNSDKEPVRGELYVTSVKTGDEEFSKMLRAKFIDPKNEKHKVALQLARETGTLELPDEEGGAVAETGSDEANAKVAAVEHFILEMLSHCVQLYEESSNASLEDEYGSTPKNVFEHSRKTAANDDFTFGDRFNAIDQFLAYVNEKDIRKIVSSFIDRSFNSPNKINKKSEPYSLEYFLSIDGKALHPNAMRYFLYELMFQLENETKNQEINEDSFKNAIDVVKLGALNTKTGQRNVAQFLVKTKLGISGDEETSLEEMCSAIDKENVSTSLKNKANRLLEQFANTIHTSYMYMLRYHICNCAKAYVSRMINQFEEFYDTFQKKVTGLEKRKKTIETKISFDRGDCIYNLFSKPEYLKCLVREQKKPSSGSEQERELFADIYFALKENGKSHDIRRSDAFADAEIKDVFESVLVESYKNIVENACPGLDMDIVRACGRECQIAAMCKAAYNPNEAEDIINDGNSEITRNAYLEDIIDKGFNLASPSLVRKSFDEDRKIDAMSFNAQMEEGDGMKMPDRLFNKKDFASNTVSKYELHFFRSIYGLTPMELHKMCPPMRDPAKPDAFLTAEDNVATDVGMVGVYFTAYQNYMQKIGPDNRLNPVITPHIDKRWNSISVMPEIDPQGYQRVLMKRIHKALIYGLIFGIIEKNYTSPHDTKKFVYEYLDGGNGTKKFTVSNHTKCDRLFEILDSLYFDRYAVHSIHTHVDAKRNREFTASTPYEKTSFARKLGALDRTVMFNENETVICSTANNGECAECEKYTEALVKDKLAALEGKKTSIFEIPLLYWRSLPKKDAAELEIMVDAVIEILITEISRFSSKDDTEALIALSLKEQYDMLYDNYEACRCLYSNLEEESKNNRAFKVIRKKVIEKIDELDVTKESFRLCDHTDKDDLFN